MDDSENRQEQIPHLFIRIIAISIIIFALVLNTFNGWGLPAIPIDCVSDSTFETTVLINSILNANDSLKHFFQILCSVSSDLLLLVAGIQWIKKGRNYRFLLALVSVYITKGFFSLIFQLKTPNGYAWGYPGFLSLTLSYNNSNHFFFSATIAMLTVLAKEYYKTKKEFLMLYAIFTILLLSFIYIFLRAHYVIDIVFAVLIGDFYNEVFNYFCYKKYVREKMKQIDFTRETAEETNLKIDDIQI